MDSTIDLKVILGSTGIIGIIGYLIWIFFLIGRYQNRFISIERSIEKIDHFQEKMEANLIEIRIALAKIQSKSEIEISKFTTFTNASNTRAEGAKKMWERRKSKNNVLEEK